MDVTWRTLSLVGLVLGLFAVATTVAQFLKRQPDIGLNPAVVQTFNSRIRAWWLMCTVLAAAFLLGSASTGATIVLFGLISFWALREFITLTPTRLGDHRTLFWVFFIFTPLQYVLVGMMSFAGWQPADTEIANIFELLLAALLRRLNPVYAFSILIPVYAFLFIPARVALSGDYKRFLERTAKIQAGLMVCVYCLSHAPALLTVPGLNQSTRVRLLFFFVLVVQLNDVLQYAWGKWLGKRVIAPAISPNKTWEGFLGGLGSATLVGAALWWTIPFQAPWHAAGMSFVICVMGFAGGMTMSAIKRDRGVKDYGTLVVGHGGVLDRIDSLCFAAPIFFHLALYYFSGEGQP